jgi:hypothetical protein
MFLVRFSALEHTLDIAVADLLSDRVHSLGYLVLEGMQLNNKLRLFRRLYQMHLNHFYPKRSKRLSSLMKKLDACRIFRNAAVHANWTTLDPSGYVRTKVSEDDGEVIFKKVKITPHIIRAWTKRVGGIEHSVFTFSQSALTIPVNSNLEMKAIVQEAIKHPIAQEIQRAIFRK